MHVPQDSMRQRILKSFWFLDETKQDLRALYHVYGVTYHNYDPA